MPDYPEGELDELPPPSIESDPTVARERREREPAPTEAVATTIPPPSGPVPQQRAPQLQQPPAEGWNWPSAPPQPQPGYQPPHWMTIANGPDVEHHFFPPSIGGLPLTPGEVGFAQAQQLLNQAQLSQADQIQLQQYQNGISAINQQLANGTLSPHEADYARQHIGQAAQPLMVRASQLPILMMRQQYALQQHQLAQAAATAERTRAFNARTAQDGLHTVRNPDTGEAAHFVEDSHGRLHPVEFPSQAAGHGREHADPAERAYNTALSHYQTQLNSAIQHHTGLVRHEREPAPGGTSREPRTPEGWGESGPVGNEHDEIRRLARQRALRQLEAAGIRPPQRPGPAGTAPTPSAGRFGFVGGQANAPAQTAPGAAAPPPPPAHQNPQVAQGFEANRQALASMEHLNPGQRQRMTQYLDSAQRTFQQYGSVQAMPADTRRRYLNTMSLLQRQANPENSGGVLEMFRSLLHPEYAPHNLLPRS